MSEYLLALWWSEVRVVMNDVAAGLRAATSDNELLSPVMDKQGVTAQLV